MPLQREGKLSKRPSHLFRFLTQLRRFSAREKPGVGPIDLGKVPAFPVAIQYREHREFVGGQDIIEAALNPGLSAYGIVDQLGIDGRFQSLRITEGADRERWRRQVEKPDELTNGRDRGSHRANAVVDPAGFPNEKNDVP
jgi:hypothetical protein